MPFALPSRIDGNEPEGGCSVTQIVYLDRADGLTLQEQKQGMAVRAVCLSRSRQTKDLAAYAVKRLPVLATAGRVKTIALFAG